MAGALVMPLPSVLLVQTLDWDWKGRAGHLYGDTDQTRSTTRFNNGGSQKYHGPKQVINLGAGIDTRVFWLECLEKANISDCEIDQSSVLWNTRSRYSRNSWKLRRNLLLPTPKCTQKVITVDLNQESQLDV